MTIAQALTILHKLYERNTDEPASSEADYSVRIELINQAINLWENVPEIAWSELVSTHEDTIATSDNDYSGPTDLIYPVGFLSVYDSNGTPTLYGYKRPEEKHKLEKTDPSATFYYLTGGDSAKIINIRPTPTAAINGQTFKLDYYKRATIYSTGEETTPIEMGDPYFAIYFALSQLYLDDRNFEAYDDMRAIANEKLSAMRIKNEATPFFQHSQMDETYFGGFGN